MSLFLSFFLFVSDCLTLPLSLFPLSSHSPSLCSWLSATLCLYFSLSSDVSMLFLNLVSFSPILPQSCTLVPKSERGETSRLSSWESGGTGRLTWRRVALSEPWGWENTQWCSNNVHHPLTISFFWFNDWNVLFLQNVDDVLHSNTLTGFFGNLLPFYTTANVVKDYSQQHICDAQVVWWTMLTCFRTTWRLVLAPSMST